MSSGILASPDFWEFSIRFSARSSRCTTCGPAGPPPVTQQRTRSFSADWESSAILASPRKCAGSFSRDVRNGGRLTLWGSATRAYIASERFLVPENDSLLFLVITASLGPHRAGGSALK